MAAPVVAKIGQNYGYALKVDNQDVSQLNLVKEFYDVTWDGGATATDKEALITTNLKTILSVKSNAVATGGQALVWFAPMTIASGVTKVTQVGTVAAKHRVELTGLSS